MDALIHLYQKVTADAELFAKWHDWQGRLSAMEEKEKLLRENFLQGHLLLREGLNLPLTDEKVSGLRELAELAEQYNTFEVDVANECKQMRHKMDCKVIEIIDRILGVWGKGHDEAAVKSEQAPAEKVLKQEHLAEEQVLTFTAKDDKSKDAPSMQEECNALPSQCNADIEAENVDSEKLQATIDANETSTAGAEVTDCKHETEAQLNQTIAGVEEAFRNLVKIDKLIEKLEDQCTKVTEPIVESRRAFDSHKLKLQEFFMNRLLAQDYQANPPGRLEPHEIRIEPEAFPMHMVQPVTFVERLLELFSRSSATLRAQSEGLSLLNYLVVYLGTVDALQVELKQFIDYPNKELGCEETIPILQEFFRQLKN